MQSTRKLSSAAISMATKIQKKKSEAKEINSFVFDEIQANACIACSCVSRAVDDKLHRRRRRIVRTQTKQTTQTIPLIAALLRESKL